MIQLDFTEWKDTLDKYKAEMDKELAAVRAAKQELVDLQRELQEMVLNGRYERDEDTLILSAPNIIIGNVDKNGNLLSGGSNITLRGNNVAIEGVGYSTGSSVSGGMVVTRARNVSIETIDPGIDGMEAVAFPDSSFTVTSAAIGLNAESVDTDPNGAVFTQEAMTAMGCVNIAAETNINISAACAITDDKMKTDATNLESKADTYGQDADKGIKLVEENAKKLEDNKNDDKSVSLIGGDNDEDTDLANLRSGMYEFDDRSKMTEMLVTDIAMGVISSTMNMSARAEALRTAKYLKLRADRLEKEKSNYEKEATGSSVTINSETIAMATVGADNAIRKSPGNGIKFYSQNYIFSTLENLKPIENSTFTVVANDIKLDASDYTYEAKDDQMQLSKTEAKGKVTINAKEVDITGNDATYEADGDKLKATPTLTKESLLYTNFSKEFMDLADEEGKAQGTFAVNSKELYLCSYDVDKESRIKPSGVADGGKITMGAKEVYLGDAFKDMKSDMVQVAAKQVNLLGEEKVNLQQASDKSHLLLDDNAELSGGNVKIIGKIALGGETKIEAKFTAGDIEAQNVKAGSSITGPNLKDGIPVPSAGAPAQPGKGADLKELEAPEKIKNDADGGGK